MSAERGKSKRGYYWIRGQLISKGYTYSTEPRLLPTSCILSTPVQRLPSVCPAKLLLLGAFCRLRSLLHQEKGAHFLSLFGIPTTNPINLMSSPEESRRRTTKSHALHTPITPSLFLLIRITSPNPFSLPHTRTHTPRLEGSGSFGS